MLAATYLIVCADGPRPAYIPETQIGFAWTDVLDAVCAGEYVGVLRILALDVARNSADDVSHAAAKQLAERSFEHRSTPAEVEAFCRLFQEPTFDPYRESSRRLGWPRRDPDDEHRLSDRQLGVGQYF